MLDENALIQSALRGHLSAFNQLILQYQGQAYNVAFRILGDEDLAADATQDGFIKAYKALNQFRGGSFRAWVMRIMTNTCYDLLRSQRRRPSSSLDQLAEDPDYEPKLVSHDEELEGFALRQELGRTLQAAINTLPPDQRATLVLSDIEGMSYEEIAVVTQVELGTVKSRLSRARSRMRALLEKQEELLPSRYRLKDS